MAFKDTEEQERIYHFLTNRTENILIKAFAGTGKTFTIVKAAKLIPKDKSITFLAFNKHIQEELKTKLPEHIRCYTTYGLGMGAIKRKYKDSIVFDEFKADKWILKKSKSWNLDDEFDSDEDKSLYLNQIKKFVNVCRLSLTLKEEYMEFIAERHDITTRKPRDIKRVMKVLDSMTNDRTLYDYTDMVYLPAIDNSIWMFPQDYVLVDEVQDFNRCQIKIVEKILKKDKLSGKITGRLIAVGDFFQGIYGFNCADDKSFKWFEDFPNTKVLPLSYSFRCAKNIILKANEIVPDIKALDDAPDGIVRNGSAINEAKGGDFILCRTTMPLVKLFFEFLLQHKKAIVKGSDIGLHLIELIGKIKTIDELAKYWERELNNFKHDLTVKGILNPYEHSGYVALEDKVSTLLFIGKMSNNINDLINKIKAIFTDTVEGIVLSTVHKAKGLEADRVFIIRPDLIPLPNTRSWQYAQEKNLEYVAISRARLELIYDYDWTDEDK
jgi:DNA helicase II / ATP-dependent DNA helicase PcrA